MSPYANRGPGVVPPEDLPVMLVLVRVHPPVNLLPCPMWTGQLLLPLQPQLSHQLTIIELHRHRCPVPHRGRRCSFLEVGPQIRRSKKAKQLKMSHHTIRTFELMHHPSTLTGLNHLSP